jgi:hypothetical protein
MANVTLICPFCKSKAVRYYAKRISGGQKPLWHNVLCMSCEAKGPKAPTEKEAIKLWNITLSTGERKMYGLIS